MFEKGHMKRLNTDSVFNLYHFIYNAFKYILVARKGMKYEYKFQKNWTKN